MFRLLSDVWVRVINCLFTKHWDLSWYWRTKGLESLLMMKKWCRKFWKLSEILIWMIQRLSSLISNIIKSSLHSHFTPNHHTTRYSINSSTRGARCQSDDDDTSKILISPTTPFRSNMKEKESSYRANEILKVSIKILWSFLLRLPHLKSHCSVTECLLNRTHAFPTSFFTDCWLVLIHDVSVLMMWFDNRSRKHRKSFHLSKHEGGSDVPAQGR